MFIGVWTIFNIFRGVFTLPSSKYFSEYSVICSMLSESSNPGAILSEHGAASYSEIHTRVVSFKLVARVWWAKMGRKESLAAATGAAAARAGLIMNGNAYIMNRKAKRCQKSSTWPNTTGFRSKSPRSHASDLCADDYGARIWDWLCICAPFYEWIRRRCAHYCFSTRLSCHVHGVFAVWMQKSIMTVEVVFRNGGMRIHNLGCVNVFKCQE